MLVAIFPKSQENYACDYASCFQRALAPSFAITARALLELRVDCGSSCRAA
jgi:hypothetical protein